jgi:hypothetical protein
MISRPVAAVILSSLFLSVPAWAGIDPSTAARLSVASAENLLAAPPLPNLEGKDKTIYTPLIGYSISKIKGVEPYRPPVAGYSYDGGASGPVGALGVTFPHYGRLSGFALVFANSFSGKIDADFGTDLFHLKDIKANVFGAVAAVNFRVLGDASSRYAVGLFSGPGYMRSSSSFVAEIDAPGAGAGSTYAMTTNIYGIYSGLQAKARWGNILFNPYVLYFADLSNKCRKFSEGTINSDPSSECTDNSIATRASFSAYGFVVGYGKFSLNIYSHTISGDEYRDITSQTYSLSYAFE